MSGQGGRAVRSRPAFGLRALDGRDDRALERGWEVVRTAPDAARTPEELARFEADFAPAAVPGTVAAIEGLCADAATIGATDHWYRCRLDPPRPTRGRTRLIFEGLSPLAEVFLDGRPILESESMFVAHAIDVGERLRPGSTLAIRFRALAPTLGARRPRGRWPTRLFPERGMRFVRTSLFGYLSGLGPAVPAVGPYRPVRLVTERDVGIDAIRVAPRVEGRDGCVEVVLDARVFCGAIGRAVLHVGAGEAEMSAEPTPDGGARLRGVARLRDVALWWPHTHGAPALHPARVELAHDEGATRVELEPVGFRTLERVGAAEGGFALRINGEALFARGACAMPIDPLALGSPEPALTRVLTLARDAGMNMLRIPGIASYEGDAFYRACDALGILVFQDFMFANLDYPADDPGFVAQVREEVDQLLARIGARPSLAVLAGGSEVAQQAAMMGRARGDWSSELFDALLPERCAALAPGVPYVPGSPYGGAMPFHPSSGLAHYYGVGAYLRSLDDARLHRVRFASECLAFSNVPEDESLEDWLGHERPPAHHPRYKARVPRDPGAGWDFADVTDHYLEALFELDARRLRYADHDRYLALSRATSAEVMERVQRFFRAEGSTCRGALVFFLRDPWDGAGLGVIDARDRPKAPYYALKRAWAPLTAFFVDEGLDGMVLHLVNDRPEAFRGEVELALLRADGRAVEQARAGVELAPRARATLGVEAALGRFVDSSYAYRFGPPAHALVAARLFAEGAAPDDALVHAHHLPLGLAHAPALDVRLSAEARPRAGGSYELTLRAERLALFVSFDAKGYRPDDAYFHLAPGVPRRITLAPQPGAPPLRGRVRAVNALGAAPIRCLESEAEGDAR
jgi:beta-mannosidase